MSTGISISAFPANQSLNTTDSPTFVNVTANLTGNASGTAATVTEATQAAITSASNLVTVGALNSGSITSGFGAIDNGASNITTTGTVQGGTGGFGLARTDGILHVHTASAGAVTANSSGDELVLENTTLSGMSFLTSNTGQASIYFGDTDNNIQGRIVYTHSNDTMAFGTTGGNTTFIDSSGHLGVGISLPDGTLHVHTATAGAVTATTTADDLVVESSGAGGISILNPDASDGTLIFGSPTNSTGALVRYNPTSATMLIGTNTASGLIQFRTSSFSTALTIDAAQNLGIGTTSFGASSVGVVGIGNATTAPTGSPTSGGFCMLPLGHYGIGGHQVQM